MIKLTDKTVASSSAPEDNIFINRNGVIMQVGMSSFSPPIVPDVSGNVILLTDSSDRPLVDLTVYGNTTQNGTPTPEAPVPLESVENPVVTISDGENQSQTLSVPYTLNGIDDVRDYVDFEKGVLVRNTVVVNNFTLSDTYTNTKLYRGTTTEDMVAGVVGTALCTHTDKYVYDTADNVHFFVGKNSIPLYLPVDFNDADLPSVKVIAQLVTPTETPLTAEEIEAFKQLTSYYPTTTITNSENAEMSVEYVADTKNYIDQKLASLVASATTTDTTEV